MDEPDPPAAPAPAPAQPEAHEPQHGHGWAYALIGVLLVSLAFGVWGAWRALAPDPQDAGDRLREQQARIEALEQRAATAARSDQVSREANRELQGTVAERDEEISALRADVAFYERFVGSTAQRRGLTVHELRLQPQDAQAWHFTATLTQNLNRGAVIRGKLTLSLEGTRDGRMQQLDWNALRQTVGAPGVDYSFKYFQQVEGDILLPPGLKPVRIVARLVPAGGAAVEQSFTWAEATGAAKAVP